MSIVVAYDVTGKNFDLAPKGAQLCLYVTGSDGVPATPAQLAANPGAVLIDQTPATGQWDKTADIDDFENGAVLLAQLPMRARERMDSFKAGTRPGQRTPAIYASANNITTVANELVGAGVTSGVGLWVANWSLTESQAIADVMAAAGPFPIIGVQFHNAGPFDINVFSGEWLANRSGQVQPPHAAIPPGQWLNPAAWTWKDVYEIGIGLDGKAHIWAYDQTRNQWVKLV